MISNTAGNERLSGMTSAGKPNTMNSRPRPHADAPSEEQFLAEELLYTESAVTECIARLRNDVMKFADPRSLVQQHPWASMGAAIAAGFVAAVAVTPAKGESLSARLSHLRPDANEAKAEVADSSVRSMIITFVITTFMNYAKDVFTQWTSERTRDGGSHPDGRACSPFSEAGEDADV